MKWLRPLFRRSAVEREMDAELRFHCERLVDEFVAKGLTPEEARRRAALEFGGLDQTKEQARDSRLIGGACRFFRALRQSLRSLVRTPGFTVTAVLMLALGIGANTGIFSLLDQMLLRELPVRDPERLVVFRSPGFNPGMDRNSGQKLSFSYPKYLDFRDRCDVFEGVAARYSAAGSLMYRGATEMVNVELVSGDFFGVLGVKPALGRVFTRADDRTQMGHPVVVLSHFYWNRRFNRDPAIVGRIIKVNGLPMTVVGVSDEKFIGIDRASMSEIRVPMMMKDLFTQDWRGGLEKTARDWAWLNIIGRIKEGIAPDQAESRANVFYREVLKDEAPMLTGPWLARRGEFLQRRLELLPASDGLNYGSRRDAGNYFLALGIMTGIVLLIACVNLAGLLLARTAARQREFAIRLALGADRFGIVRHLLAENLIIAAAGGTVGVLLATAFGRTLMKFLTGPAAGDVYSATPDLRVLLFAVSLTALAAILLAFAPLFQVRQTRLTDSLKPEGGGFMGASHLRFRKTLLVLQIAFCAWLVIAAGLFARSLVKLRAVDLGFKKENLIVFYLDPSVGGHDAPRSMAITRGVEEALAAVPGIAAVGSSDNGVMMGKGINLNQLRVEGSSSKASQESDAPFVYQLVVTPGFLRGLGLPLLAGRDFSSADMVYVQEGVKTERRSQSVAIVNQAFADRFFKGKNPVGRHVTSVFNKDHVTEIVGLVGNQKYFSPREPGQPFYYQPQRYIGGVTYYVRTARPPETMLATVRKVVESQAPGVPIDRLQTMESRMDQMMASDRQMAMLASFFGSFAVFLAAIGIYGVMAYTVARRTREIGIRMALGARPAGVQWLVIGETGLLVGLGLLIGIPSGLAGARLIEAQLYGVSPVDLLSAVIAGLIVAAFGLLAALAPARRATRVSPMLALRWE